MTLLADAIMWLFWSIGLLTFVSMWVAAAQLLWHALAIDWHWSDK